LGEVLSGPPINTIIHYDPIDRNLGKQVFSSRHGNTRIIVCERAGIRHGHDTYARLKTREFQKVAAIKRQVLNLNLTDTAVYRKLAGVNTRCLTAYQDSFVD